MSKFDQIDESPITPDDLYSPRELSMKKEFRVLFGRRKYDNLSDISVYTYILDAIRRGMLPYVNVGKGENPYYKVLGNDVLAFAERMFGARYVRGGGIKDANYTPEYLKKRQSKRKPKK